MRRVILSRTLKRAAIVVCSILLLVFLAGAQEHQHMHPAAADDGFFAHLFKLYTPRRICMLYEQPVIWLHVFSDALIAVAYFSIPFALVHFVRNRKDVVFGSVFWMFAAFILACGTTHLIGVADIWAPFYRLDGIIKLITGILSVWTAIALWKLMPKLLALPSPAMLEATVKERTAELKQVAEERQRLLISERAARADAERANHVKDEFLATLSHELRTPLNAILGWAQVLQRGSNSEQDVAEGLGVIERNARMQTQLIGDLLDMSRIVSGTFKLEFRRINPTASVNAAIDALAPTAESKGVRIERDLRDSDDTILGDPERLQQVVWNLLSNAIKFTPRDGSVKVTLDRTGDRLQIVVADTGQGISANFLPHVFERFRQADSSITRRHGGLGIGLSIVKQIVELHGGTVAAYSAGEQRGATFTVTLPIASVEHDRQHTAPATSVDTTFDATLAQKAIAGMKVLVVDDEADTRDVIARILRDCDVEVISAASAPEALAMLKKHRPAAILSDIGMPGNDGFDFIRQVRALSPEEGGTTPAAAITAFVRTEDRVQSLSAGYQRHLAKPIAPADLINTLASITGRTTLP